VLHITPCLLGLGFVHSVLSGPAMDVDFWTLSFATATYSVVQTQATKRSGKIEVLANVTVDGFV
jgi:hypothetical protein